MSARHVPLVLALLALVICIASILEGNKRRRMKAMLGAGCVVVAYQPKQEPLFRCPEIEGVIEAKDWAPAAQK